MGSAVEPHMMPRFPLSRVALALAHVDADLQTHGELRSFIGTSAPDVKLLRFDPSQLPANVKRLYDSAPAEWSALTTHPFPAALGSGKAYLNGFRHYMIQDAKYLEYYARVRMQSIANSGSGASFKEIVEFAKKLSNSFEYSVDLRNVCTQKLGVPEDVVANEPMSQELKNSIELYESVVRNQRGDWLAIHVVLLPCIMGYYAIASQLLESPAVVANTPYYPLWVQFNSGSSTFNKYTKLINDSIAGRNPSDADWTYWETIFRSACGTETAFFGLGLKDITYRPVAEGLYFIRNRGGNNLYLDVQGEQVVVRNNPARWSITSATMQGYNIVNNGNSLPLSAAIADSFPSYYNVKCAEGEEKWWSIIPVNGNAGFQLLLSKHLQYALTANVGASETKGVIATNNYGGTDQAWLLEPVPVQ